MADTYMVIYRVTQNDTARTPITTNSPIALRPKGGAAGTRIEGTHISNGLWKFEITSGKPEGWVIDVQTSAAGWTEDVYLNGSPTGNGRMLAPVVEIG